VANLFTRLKSAFKAVPALEQPPAKPPANDVLTVERNTFGSVSPRYNPDQLVGRQGLEIYQKMRLDEQVKAVMNFKRDAITARGWTFKYEDDSKLSETERANRVHIFSEILCRMQGSFIDGLNLIASGRDFGFSNTEKVYTEVTIGGQTYIGLSMLMGRDPSTFFFHTDDYGILQKLEQVAAIRRIEVDMARVIHYVHSPEFDRYYGRSDLREAYRAWFMKQRIGEFWVEYLERMGGGFVVANRTADCNISFGTPEYTSLQKVLTNLHGTSGIAPPPGVEIEVHWPVSTDAFEKAMVFQDLAIAKALLVPNLLGISHAGQTGSFSQSQTQLEAFFWTLNADSERLQACINEQLVKDLGDQNFGDGDYPEFSFKPASREHILQLIDSWAALTGAKAVIATEEDEDHFRKLLEMPKRSPTSKPLAQEMPAQPGAAPDAGKTIPASETGPKAGGADAAYTRDLNQLEERLTKLITTLRPVGEARQPAQANGAHSPGSQVVPHGKLRSATRAQFDRATQRVAFTVIENRQDRMAADLTSQVSALVAKAAKRMLGTDEDVKKLTDADPTDIAGVEFTSSQKSKLKDLYRRSLASAWTLGGTMARNEIERARGQRSVAMADLRDKAASYFEANGFRMAGNVSDGARAVIQQELQNSVKFGRTPKDTREAIWGRLVDRGFTSRESVLEVEDDPEVAFNLKELWGVGERQTASYLDTLSRTNLFEAMNEARYTEFTDPALGDFVQALEWSSVLDDRTTEICSYMNGRVYATDSEVWQQIRCPAHYNCRSVLIPITAMDGWDGHESDPPTVQAQAGFGAGTLQ